MTTTKIRFPASQTKPMFPDIPEAPTFRPTHEEFRDPYRFLEMIRPEAERWGICRIIPPPEDEAKNIAGFREEVFKYFSSVDPTLFKFKTKLQAIHQLQWRSGPNERFLDDLKRVLLLSNTTFYTPYIGNVAIDLYRLYFEVYDRHGFSKITEQQWGEVATALHVPLEGSGIVELKKIYSSLLLPYEPHFKEKQKEKKKLAPVCAVCKDDDKKNFLICDRDGCGKAYHLKCVKSPLVVVPRAFWLCPPCQATAERAEEQGFGYPDGSTFNLCKYEKQASSFKKTFFGDKNPTVNEIEREYWRIVLGGEENIQVYYGSDVDCTKKHSGFPPPRHKNQFALSGWNVNNLPKVHGSILRYISSKLAGVTHPMMYIGMLFSTFCWHNEDNYLYSINYLHTGEPKLWYGIPGGAAGAFEGLMRETYPHLFKEHNDLLYHLVTTLTPGLLLERGIPVCRAVQEQGNIMITFPQAYHAGFNTGFNVAESVNFAPPDWLPFGRDAKERYRTVHGGRTSVFSHEELVLCASRDPELKSNLAKWLVPELELILQEEQNYRFKLSEHGIRSVLEDERRLGEAKQCTVCRFDCFLDWITCDACAAWGCLRHAAEMCPHPLAARTLHLRVSTDQLLSMLNRCRTIAQQPQESVNSSVVLSELGPKMKKSRGSSGSLSSSQGSFSGKRTRSSDEDTAGQESSEPAEPSLRRSLPSADQKPVTLHASPPAPPTAPPPMKMALRTSDSAKRVFASVVRGDL